MNKRIAMSLVSILLLSGCMADVDSNKAKSLEDLSAWKTESALPTSLFSDETSQLQHLLVLEHAPAKELYIVDRRTNSQGHEECIIVDDSYPCDEVRASVKAQYETLFGTIDPHTVARLETKEAAQRVSRATLTKAQRSTKAYQVLKAVLDDDFPRRATIVDAYPDFESSLNTDNPAQCDFFAKGKTVTIDCTPEAVTAHLDHDINVAVANGLIPAELYQLRVDINTYLNDNTKVSELLKQHHNDIKFAPGLFGSNKHTYPLYKGYKLTGVGLSEHTVAELKRALKEG